MEALELLREEFAQFATFKFPESVRAMANEAMNAIHKKDLSLPIESCESPVVRIVNTILTNPKLAKASVTIVERVLKCINAGVFGPAAIDRVVRGLVEIGPELGEDSAVSFLQGAATGIAQNFPQMNMIEAYFSMVLAMMSHSNVIISSSAFAAFPQILQSLVDEITSAKDVPKAYLDYCNGCKSHNVFKRFEKPLYFILYLLFNDISCIGLKQPLAWLHVKKPPTGAVFDLLELVVNGYANLLKEDPQLLSIFQGTVIQAMNDDASLQFVVAFIEEFIETETQLCSCVFRDYLQRISAKSRKNHIPLFFFRSVVTTSKTLAARVFELCDTENTMFVSLVNTLCAFAEPNSPSSPIAFSLLKSRLSSVTTGKGKNSFTLTSPYEIAFGLVISFADADTGRMVEFMEKADPSLLKMFTFALLFSTPSSFNLPCEALKAMLVLLKKHNMNEAFEKALKSVFKMNFAESLNKKEQKTFGSEEKLVKYHEFLCGLSNTNPIICEGKWTELFNVVFSSETPQLDNYGLSFSDDVLVEAFKGMVTARPINHGFVSQVICVNHTRFEIVWKFFKKTFISALRAKVIDMNIFDLFLCIIERCIFEESEEMILEMGVQFVAPGSPLDLSKKTLVLQQIRYLISAHVEQIKNGWSSLFQTLSPVNYEGDQEILQTSFSVLNLICNDHFHLVPQNSLRACVELIFQFAASDADINISLSSFDLLWVVVRVIDNSFDSWKSLMEKVMLLIQDSRSDVRQCAIRTFGSLMSSNFAQIPKPVFHFLLEEGFPKLLAGFNLNDQNVLADFSLALQELAHWTGTFWDSFCEDPIFLAQFVPSLIQYQTNFVLKCENLEVVAKGFQFYEGLFQSPSLSSGCENLLRGSIATINDYFMKMSDQGSIVFSSFGRLLGTIMVSLKTRNVTDTLPLWFPIIEKIVKTCKSVQFVHITPSRILDSIPSLFPMSEEATFKVVPFLIGFIEYKDSPALPEYAANLLLKIWKDGLQPEFRCRFAVECKPLYYLASSEALMTTILEAKVDASGDCANELFACYSVMAKTCKSLEKYVNASLVVKIDKMTKDGQESFLESNKNDFRVLSLVWKTFFDRNSDKFSQEVYDNCFEKVLDCFGELLNDCHDVIPVLDFLLSCDAPERTVNGKATKKWFVLKLMPSLSGLITQESKEVRSRVQSLMGSVAPFLCSIC